MPIHDIIGIAGPTCSGKTSLLEELLSRMPDLAVGLSMDEYDLFPQGSTAMDEELKRPTITNWEDPALFDLEQYAADAEQLHEGKAVRLQTRSRESIDRGDSERELRPARYTFTEGVFAFHQAAVRKVLSLSMFVDIPLDVMVERRLSTLRPGSSGNPWDDPAYIQGPMVEATRRFILPQRELARLVLDGTRPTKDLADDVMPLLPTELL